jgi:hypothetical protein
MYTLASLKSRNFALGIASPLYATNYYLCYLVVQLLILALGRQKNPY